MQLPRGFRETSAALATNKDIVDKDEQEKELTKSNRWETGSDSFDGLKSYFYVDTFDASKILFFYILWNIMSAQMYKVHQKCHVNAIKSKRVSESIWRCLYQATMVSYGTYRVLTANENLMFRPGLAWQSWGDSEQLNDCLQIYFLMQLSFHIYSITYLLKEARKEYHAYSFLTLHTLQFIMVSLFYTLHYYQVGLLVCVFYDTPALAIEVTRINVYLEKISSVFRYFSYMSFSMYTMLWLCNTLYLYPTKILYFGIVSTMEKVDRPLVETVTFGLILLQLFNLYWLLILLQWSKKMLKTKKKKDYFVVYCFFHKRGVFKCSRAPPREEEKLEPDAKALMQTVKCVIRLNRKLKRIRAEKMEEPEPEPETQLIELEISPHDTLTIDFVKKKESDDKDDESITNRDSKSDVKFETEGYGEMTKSSDDLTKFASFTSAETSKTSASDIKVL